MVPSLNSARDGLRIEKFDAVLVDYDLDDGKGDELVRESRGRHCKLPIIGVSSHDEGYAALLRAGASAICSKMEFDRIEQFIQNAA